jgi:hypothetical protein
MLQKDLSLPAADGKRERMAATGAACRPFLTIFRNTGASYGTDNPGRDGGK